VKKTVRNIEAAMPFSNSSVTLKTCTWLADKYIEKIFGLGTMVKKQQPSTDSLVNGHS
jgi:hypothetical protein